MFMSILLGPSPHLFLQNLLFYIEMKCSSSVNVDADRDIYLISGMSSISISLGTVEKDISRPQIGLA